MDSLLIRGGQFDKTPPAYLFMRFGYYATVAYCGNIEDANYYYQGCPLDANNNKDSSKINSSATIIIIPRVDH